MKFGVIVFPGSNCDQDCYDVIKNIFKKDIDFIWHKEDTSLSDFDCIILPGGFSYGDYLRTGAIAQFSPVIKLLRQYASQGGLVIGICNGFQILLESGLLPGAMVRNRSLKFICKYIYVRVENENEVFTNKIQKNRILAIPIAHAEGNYFIDQTSLSTLKKNKQIIFRYCDMEGRVTDEANPNGSVQNIAGICNREGNVLGMMPHPERCSELVLGSEDGKSIFQSIIHYVENKQNKSQKIEIG